MEEINVRHVVHPVCCGIDGHPTQLTACLRRVGDEGTAHTEWRDFHTTYEQLVACRDWLTAQDCPLVVLESTGVYWKPIYHVLVETVEVIIANARSVRQRPGRKTDKADAAWLAEPMGSIDFRGISNSKPHRYEEKRSCLHDPTCQLVRAPPLPPRRRANPAEIGGGQHRGRPLALHRGADHARWHGITARHRAVSGPDRYLNDDLPVHGADHGARQRQDRYAAGNPALTGNLNVAFMSRMRAARGCLPTGFRCSAPEGPC